VYDNIAVVQRIVLLSSDWLLGRIHLGWSSSSSLGRGTRSDVLCGDNSGLRLIINNIDKGFWVVPAGFGWMKF
jgi:hypothetical protein